MLAKFVLPALSLVAASASASAAQTDQRTPAAEPAAATTASAAAKPNRICIKYAPMIGSRIEKMECKTRQEWARDGIDIDEMIR